MSDCSNYTVYAHINKVNGKIYIGITSMKVEYRWRNGKGYINNQHFTRAIKKYGWDNFDHEIIASSLTKEEACNFEEVLIQQLQSTNPLHGYNKSIGGDISSKGVIRSEDTKNRISQSLKGRTWSEESKKKLSISKRQENLSEETRKKLSIANSNKKYTEESRKKMSEAHKGKVFTEEHKEKLRKSNSKSVICISTNEIFESAKIAGQEKNCNFRSIGNCCRGESRSCGGYKWLFYEEYIKMINYELFQYGL